MCASFPFGFEGGMWGLIILVPGHCLSFYLENFIFFGVKTAILLPVVYKPSARRRDHHFCCTYLELLSLRGIHFVM